jgi:hypothetical protein
MQSSTIPPLGRHSSVYTALPAGAEATALVVSSSIASRTRGPRR